MSDTSSDFPTKRDISTCVEAYHLILQALQVAGMQDDRGERVDLSWRRCKASGVWHYRLDDGTEIWPYDGPETVVLSSGYAQVWSDGEVTGIGESFYVDEGGLVGELPAGWIPCAQD